MLYIADVLATVDLSQIDLDADMVVGLSEAGFSISDTATPGTQHRNPPGIPLSPAPLQLNELLNEELLQSDEPYPSSDGYSRASSPEPGPSRLSDARYNSPSPTPTTSHILSRFKRAPSRSRQHAPSQAGTHRMARPLAVGRTDKEVEPSRKRRKLTSEAVPQAAPVQRSADLDSETEFPKRINQLEVLRKLNFGQRK
jgi:hypothetical protein